MKVKKMTARLCLICSTAVAALLSIPFANAGFGLPNIPIPGAYESKTGGTDLNSLLSQQKDLLGRFNQSMSSMLTAQALTLEAGGLKKEADLASATAANYKDGTVHTKDQLERDTKISADASKAIDNLMKKNTALSAEGQKKLLTAVPHYAKGMYEGTKLPEGFQAWTDSAKSGLNTLAADPLSASKLSSGIGDLSTVATNLPALISSWTTTSKAFMAYAKSNKVDVKDLSSKMGDL